MKRILSLLLCAVMLASALASCAVNDSQRISQNISVASSAAEDYALWLTDRLGLVPDNVIMAVGDDNSYGIDMSDFEDDGYVIKNVGGDVLLLGKTGEGLDELLHSIDRMMDKGTKRYTLHIPYDKGGLLDALYCDAKVESVEYGETIDVVALCDPRTVGQVKDYIEGYVEPKEDWE